MAVKTEVTVRTTVVKHECEGPTPTLGDLTKFVTAAGKMPLETPIRLLGGSGGRAILKAEEIWTDAPQAMDEKAVSA